MSQLHCLELTAAAGPLDRLARQLHDVAAGADLVVSVSQPGDPADVVLTLRSGLLVSVSPPVSTGPDPFVADFGIERAATVDM